MFEDTNYKNVKMLKEGVLELINYFLISVKRFWICIVFQETINNGKHST